MDAGEQAEALVRGGVGDARGWLGALGLGLGGSLECFAVSSALTPKLAAA